MKDISLKLRLLSSLEKVFADEEPVKKQWEKATMLMNEVFSFQVAYNWIGNMKKNVQVIINSRISQWITISKIGLVPSEMPCFSDYDSNVLRTVPGLYPDPLIPLDDGGITLLPEQWRALWITINPDKKVHAGVYPVEVIFLESSGEELGRVEFNIELFDVDLPEQRLIHTEWFHVDCLAVYYGLEIFDDEHWKRIGQFIDTAVKNGINMILTPLFTPPLDTEVGGERPSVQLVDVEKIHNTYRFGFEKLKKWVDLCRAKGVKYFEFSHLFTQWGARHAPKIMAAENGKLKRIFGWDTNATGEEYLTFLSLFIKKLIEFIKDNNIEKFCFFHVSDEPGIKHLEYYKKASDAVNGLVEGYPVIDALSDYSFYETGIVKNPIPATDHINVFLENNVPNLWTYYCNGQYDRVSNRFFNMPSARNRIIGMQLYKFKIRGFLHWGYNFWYSQYSRYPIDPFRVTDAGYAFPSGDAFVVYPGKDAPVESLRLKVFYDALQDLRALELLEEFIGREAVVNMLEDDLEQPITFFEYPKEAEWLLQKREQINRMLKSLACDK